MSSGNFPLPPDNDPSAQQVAPDTDATPPSSTSNNQQPNPKSKKSGLGRLQTALKVIQGLSAGAAAGFRDPQPLEEFNQQEQQDLARTRQQSQDAFNRANEQRTQTRADQEAQAREAEEGAQTRKTNQEIQNYRSPVQVAADTLAEKEKQLQLEQKYAKPQQQVDQKGNVYEVNPATASATPVHIATQVNPQDIGSSPVTGHLFPPAAPMTVQSNQQLNVQPKGLTGGVDMQTYEARVQKHESEGDDPVTARLKAGQEHEADLRGRVQSKPNSLLERWNLFQSNPEAYDEMVRGNKSATNDVQQFQKAEQAATKIVDADPTAKFGSDYHDKIAAETQRQIQAMDSAAQSHGHSTSGRPSKGDMKTYQGHNYVFDGKNYVLQTSK